MGLLARRAQGEAKPEQRLALVIGNGAYATSPLRNPTNDARALGKALEALGFEVMAHENLDQREMRRAILDFGTRLREGGVGLLYFAGHGLQVNGRNYRVPVDAAINVNLVILDACRDNPFARSFRSASRGLAAIDAPSGTLIAYATAPGRVARDGEGANGLYTGELLRALQAPGQRVEDVFKRVRQSVLERSGGDQVPGLAGTTWPALHQSRRQARRVAGEVGPEGRRRRPRRQGVLAVERPAPRRHDRGLGQQRPGRQVDPEAPARALSGAA